MDGHAFLSCSKTFQWAGKQFLRGPYIRDNTKTEKSTSLNHFQQTASILCGWQAAVSQVSPLRTKAEKQIGMFL
eukprot:scaffold261420_cov36-Prasinocladus_malaysianus.AAC.1